MATKQEIEDDGMDGGQNGAEVLETDETEQEADEQATDAEADPDGDDGAAADDDSIEARARALGWAPKSQWRGKPELWKSAEDFLAFMDDRPLVLQERNRKLTSQLDSVSKQLEVLTKRVEDQDKRGYERAMAEIRAGKKQAVADGDTEAFERFETQEDELRKQQAPAEAPKQQTEPPDISAWKRTNKWFGTNRGMTQTAEGQYTAYFDEHPDESMDDEASRERALKFVDRRMRTIFPEQFENPNRQTARTPNGVPSAKKVATKTYADLPPDAKRACDSFVDKGIFKSRDDYVKDYFA